MKRLLLTGLLCLLAGFALGRWERPTSEQQLVETFEQVRTVIVREHVEIQRKSEATERIVERKILVPQCELQKPPEQIQGKVLLEERIIERAIAQSEQLRLDSGGASQQGLSVHEESSSRQVTSGPDWNVQVMGGVTALRWTPTLGAMVTRRIIGPFSVGLWGTYATDGQFAGGASVGVQW